MSEPKGEPLISSIRNRRGFILGDTRLIVAFSRPLNLGNHFSPRKLHPPGVSPSLFFEDELTNK